MFQHIQFFYKQQGLSNESLDCKNVKQRESRFETKMAMLSNKKMISKQENMKKCNDSASEMFIMTKHDLKKQFKIVLAILDDSICSTFDVDAQKP